MRKTLTFVMVLGGFALQAISYFFLSAPLGTPVNEAFSNPRVPFAAGFFVLGVMLVFIAAVVYEVLPERYGE